MPWTVEFHAAFVVEFRRLGVAVQDEILALAEKMRVVGPSMKRPASGDNSRVSRRRFYQTLIAVANASFTSHLQTLEED